MKKETNDTLKDNMLNELGSVHIKSKTKVKARNKGCGRNKNRIKLIVASKNFSKAF